MTCNSSSTARAATQPGTSGLGTGPKGHPLFERYPLDGEARLSIGTVPTPYHVYNGYGLFIGGRADLTAVRELLEPEHVRPVRTDTGHALMGIWVCNFTDASLGAHHELQFSIFVSDGEVEPVASHRLSLIELMVNRPEVKMLCHGLWNSTQAAVAYNRELLALNARPGFSRIVRDAYGIHFSFDDAVTNAPILDGWVDRPRRPSPRTHLALMARLGIRRLNALAREPWIRMEIVNPVGARLNRNAVAESYTRNEVNVIRYFDSTRDTVVFGDTRYRRLLFKPQFVQYMDGFKLVYLFPK